MKLFVWDFHGVLEKGNDFAVIEITNSVLKKFGYKKLLTTKQAKLLTGRKWHKYFAYLLPEESQKTHLDLQLACYDKSRNSFDVIAKHLKINDHATEVLETISKSPYDQILISNSNQEGLEMFIKIVDIEKHFSKNHIIGIDAHVNHRSTKKKALLHFLKDNNKKYSKLITIGDSKGDIELASLHENSVSYLYSYPDKPHRDCFANYKITNLKKVLQELK